MRNWGAKCKAGVPSSSAHFGSELLLQRLQDVPYNLLGVLVGQGLVLVAHGQREGHGLPALDDVGAGVDVEDRAVDQAFAARGQNRLLHVAHRNRQIADHGNVAGDRRILRLSIADCS